MNFLGYPFEIIVEGDPAKGSPASLSVELKELPSEDTFNEIRAGVAWFSDLANYGGMGGASISPIDCICDLNKETEPQTLSTHLVWQFNKITIAPESLNILFRLFHFVDADIQRVKFISRGMTPEREIKYYDFPGIFSTLPFQFADSRENRNVGVRIECRSDIPENIHEKIITILQTWSLIGAMGGFDLPSSTSNMPMGIVPDDDPEIVLDLVEFNFRDNGINDTGYSVLANMCLKMHHQIVPVKSLEIS